MEAEIKKIWNPNETKAPLPSPIEMRECACGCGYSFQPSRRDKIYLNNMHANYGYNHGKRKEKNKKLNDLNKKLLNNERVLEKYFNAYNGNPIVAPLINLKVDGFIDNLYLGINNQSSEIYYYLYHYGFSIYIKDNQTLVKIYKFRKNESV